MASETRRQSGGGQEMNPTKRTMNSPPTKQMTANRVGRYGNDEEGGALGRRGNDAVFERFGFHSWNHYRTLIAMEFLCVIRTSYCVGNSCTDKSVSCFASHLGTGTIVSCQSSVN